ncbi:MAG: thioredoxin domain-containing protein [Bacteroidales bacterium]|nr:thioredoxin domain-containing protein [Bacteroidales bacterium]
MDKKLVLTLLSVALLITSLTIFSGCGSATSNQSENTQENKTNEITQSQPTTNVKEEKPSFTNNGFGAKPQNEEKIDIEIEEIEDEEIDEEPEYENNGKIITLTDKTFNELCIDTQTDDIMCPVPFIIDYNATWCGPCRQIAPILAKLQKEYGNKIQIFSVDIDKCPNASEYFDFDAIPTLIFVDYEGNCEHVTGGLPESELRSLIKQYLKVK